MTKLPLLATPTSGLVIVLTRILLELTLNSGAIGANKTIIIL
jgi:hypothetical protein